MSLIDPAIVTDVALDYMNDDHMAFTAALNALVEYIRAKDRAAVTRLLDDILLETREHFAREERDMRLAQFPPYPVHKAEHDRLVAELEDVVQHWIASQDMAWLSGYIAERLAPWFLQHVATMDKVTARYVAMRQATSAA